MKKTLVLSAAVMMLFGASVFAKESTLIDFTMLDADITIKAQDSDVEIPENSRTIMDYGVAAGASFDQDQKDLMKTSLYIGDWEVVLNSSAQTVPLPVPEAPETTIRHPLRFIVIILSKIVNTAVNATGNSLRQKRR